jgi:hypothetical protein
MAVVGGVETLEPAGLDQVADDLAHEQRIAVGERVQRMCEGRGGRALERANQQAGRVRR